MAIFDHLLKLNIDYIRVSDMLIDYSMGDPKLFLDLGRLVM